MTDKVHWPIFVRYIGLWWVLAAVGAGALAFVSTWLAGLFIVVFSLFVWWNARRLIIKYKLPTMFGVRSREE